ncbi:MAG: shikimate dehydrogenase [Solobacterium sp.]|nr:shikimate dehydrogenase [Solobacterium sp.]
MKLGLIGYPLGHSWSPEIHHFLCGEDYTLFSLKEEDMKEFLEKKDFDGMNITIPYKEKVIPYLDEMSDEVKRIQAVNCIANRNGKLVGYNSDVEGFRYLLEANGIDYHGKKIAILGSGGAMKACLAVLEKGSNTIDIVSRTASKDRIDYTEFKNRASEYELLVNATPVGIYPKEEEMLNIDLDACVHLKAVVDIIANPLCTRLMFEAKKRGIKAVGGFEMLVAQALFAEEFFFEKEIEKSKIEECLTYLYEKRRNIVLIGMPSSGKSTIASYLGKRLKKEVIDLDQIFVEREGKEISSYFEEHGEESFRKKESELVKEFSKKEGMILSCGGGVVVKEENMLALSHRGYIIWIDRDLNLLEATEDRPLSSNIEALKKRYEERRELYASYSDIVVQNNTTIEEAIEEICRKVGYRK